MRRKVSLLLSEGHLDAADYPLGMVEDEVALVVERVNSAAATQGVITQAAAGSIVSKEGGNHFRKLIKLITGD